MAGAKPKRGLRTLPIAHQFPRLPIPVEIRPRVGTPLADHLFRGISRSSRSFLFTDPTCRSSAMAISRAPIFLRTIALRRPNSASDQSCGRAGFFRMFFGGGSDVAWLTESPSGGPASYFTASGPAPAKAAARLLLSPPEPFRAGQPQSYRHGRFPWVGFPSRKATSLGKASTSGRTAF